VERAVSQRRHELEVFADCIGEPHKALIRSALTCQDKGDIEASARIAVDQCMKRPRMRWAAILLALQAAELKLAGAVAFETPSKHLAPHPETGFLEERYGEVELRTFPEDVRVKLELEPTPEGGFLVRGQGPFKKAMRYDKLVREGARTLCSQLAAHLGVIVSMDR
jgi:hypothetical protein